MGDRQISTQVRELIKCIFQFIFYYTQVRVVNCSVRVPRVLCAGITRASSVFNAAVHESGTVVFEEKLSTDYLRLVWSKFRHKDSSHNYGKSTFCASFLANSEVISKVLFTSK